MRISDQILTMNKSKLPVGVAFVCLQILIILHDFETENCCDHLEIYDGTSTIDHRLQRLSGSGTYGSVVTSGHQAFLQFNSDLSVTFDGFNISLETYTGIVVISVLPYNNAFIYNCMSIIISLLK